ncbi:MAG: hypothetical protein AAGA68_20550 [Pseudomonadota bacterium]
MAELPFDAATGDIDPRQAAETVLRTYEHDDRWLDAFAEHLDRRRAGESLGRVLDAWGLSQSDAARMFGVSRQAVAKWVASGVPAERSEAIADLAAATDLLVQHLKRDRIAAVVRRPMGTQGERSLVDLLRAQNTQEVLSCCRAMFDFASAQGG